MPSSTHKKRRLKKSSRRSIPTIDRISDLPDSILCHILYFLPTKHVATTSVLSKRWKRLWLSVLAIIFDSRDFKTSDLFLRVLYSTMYRRETTLPIYSFFVKSDANSSLVIQKDVNQFVYHVLQRGIQDFYLILSKKSRKIIELPATILSCTTLKFLKLRNLTVGDISQVDLYLPSLKSLHLNKVEFGCHEHLMKLLSSCPILENLEITKRCFIQKDVNQFVFLVLQRGIQNLCLNLSKVCLYTIELSVTILSCRTLKVLKLKNLKARDISQVDLFLPNLKTLHLHKIYFKCQEHLLKLLLSCPILEDLDTKRIFVMDFVSHFSVDFTAFPNLIKARISEFYIPLSMVRKAEILRVESVFMLTCCTQLPMFESLTHLELSLHSEVGNPKWEWLLGMLKLSPKLQNLIIQDNKDLRESSDECLEDPPLVPECLSSQLKTCRIRVFKGTKYDLEFAKYIMENSKALETMTINSICSLDINAKDQLLMKLSSCKRGSTTCKLLFD